jgi:hypothetical protein
MSFDAPGKHSQRENKKRMRKPDVDNNGEGRLLSTKINSFERTRRHKINSIHH